MMDNSVAATLGYLAEWHGFDICDIIDIIYNDSDDDNNFDVENLWSFDMDMTIEVGDMVIITDLLTLGGCLDSELL